MSDQPVAIVTGASRGIGRAIAISMARAGHGVVVNYLKNETAAEQVVGEIRDAGGRAIAIGAKCALGRGWWSTLGWGLLQSHRGRLS